MPEASADRRRGAVALGDDGEEDQGSATMLSSISGLTNTIIGAGMLALPHAYAKMGWLQGSLLVVLCAVVTNFGLYLIKLCADRMDKRVNSFYDMTSQVMPSAVWYFDATIFVKCFGVGVSYLMISGNLMPQVILSLARALGVGAKSVPSWLLSTPLWILVCLTLMAPACFYRKLDSLRIIGYLNMGAVAYLLLILFYYFVNSSAAHLPSHGEMDAVLVSTDVLRTFPIMVFAYTCAQNILPVYNELQHSTVERSTLVTVISVGASALVYLVVALVGYATFGSNVSDNIIAMYPDTNLFVCFGKLSVIALTLTSYPMQLYPCRASLLNMLEVNVDVLSATEAEQSMLGASSGEMDPVLHREIGERRWTVLTLALMSAGLFISMLVNDLSVVLGIVGSVGSTTISFILPALLYRSIFREDAKSPLYTAATALGVWGAIVLVLALTVNISKIFQGL